MDISKLKGTHLVTTVFEFETEDGVTAHETINVWVKREAWCLEKQDALGSGEGMRIATALSEMIARWDITLDGEPYEPSMVNIYQMQDSLLAEIGKSVIGSFAVNPTKAKPSLNGSAQTAKQTIAAQP